MLAVEYIVESTLPWLSVGTDGQREGRCASVSGPFLLLFSCACVYPPTHFLLTWAIFWACGQAFRVAKTLNHPTQRTVLCTELRRGRQFAGTCDPRRCVIWKPPRSHKRGMSPSVSQTLQFRDERSAASSHDTAYQTPCTSVSKGPSSTGRRVCESRPPRLRLLKPKLPVTAIGHLRLYRAIPYK